MPNNANCGNCHFRREDRCKRFPPTVIPYMIIKQTAAYDVAVMPNHVWVSETDWCGEHRYKEK